MMVTIQLSRRFARQQRIAQRNALTKAIDKRDAGNTTAMSFDEAEHPRVPSGSSTGGEFTGNRTATDATNWSREVAAVVISTGLFPNPSRITGELFIRDFFAGKTQKESAEAFCECEVDVPQSKFGFK